MKKISELFPSNPYLICLIASSFIFYKYLLQIFPSVISSDLMQYFQLTGAGLGNLTACFLYTYLFMQIPAGMILDKYHLRTVMVTAIMGSAAFLLLFVLAGSTFIGGIARAGMGIAAAFAFNAYMKTITVWVPMKHFAVMAGFGLTIAMLGAMTAQAPLGILVNIFGWRYALAIIAFLGLILAGLCWLIIKNSPNANALSIKPLQESPAGIFFQLNDLIRNKQNWILGFYCACAFAPLSVFGGLWGIPFMKQAYHLSTVEAARNVSLIYLGFAIGSPLLGWFSDLLSKRVMVMFMGTLLGLISLSSAIYLSFILTPMMASGLLFLFGLGMGGLMLCFVVAVEIRTTIFFATLIAFINTLPSIFEAFTEPLIGKILDLGWDGTLVNGARIFSVDNFYVGFLILPAYLFIALILLFFIKDKVRTVIPQ